MLHIHRVSAVFYNVWMIAQTKQILPPDPAFTRLIVHPPKLPALHHARAGYFLPLLLPGPPENPAPYSPLHNLLRVSEAYISFPSGFPSVRSLQMRRPAAPVHLPVTYRQRSRTFVGSPYVAPPAPALHRGRL